MAVRSNVGRDILLIAHCFRGNLKHYMRSAVKFGMTMTYMHKIVKVVSDSINKQNFF